MGECHCSKIAIMQLFHELKQQFPALPDHVVYQCIAQNSYDRESCARSLRASQATRPPPGAFPPPPPPQLDFQPVVDLTTPPLSVNAMSRHPSTEGPPVQEFCQLLRLPVNPQSESSPTPIRKVQRPVSLDISREKSGSAMVHSEIPTERQFEEVAGHQGKPSFELSVNVTRNPGGSQAHSSPSSLLEPLTLSDLPPHETISLETEEGSASFYQQQQTLLLANPSSQSPSTATPQSTRSFTSVSLTLRTPSSEPQTPIDISSQGGSSLTYSSSSLDPRGFQSHLQISIGHGNTGATSARIRPPIPQRPTSLVTGATHSAARPPGLPMGPPIQLARPTTTMSAPSTPSSFPPQSIASVVANSLPTTPSVAPSTNFRPTIKVPIPSTSASGSQPAKSLGAIPRVPKITRSTNIRKDDKRDNEIPLEFHAILDQVEAQFKPLILDQLIRKEKMVKALTEEKLKLEVIKKEIDNLTRLHESEVSPKQIERQLRSEIYQLQLECDKLAEEVDRNSEDPRVPLGETDEEFYQSIYTGQEFVPPVTNLAEAPPLPSQPPAWETDPNQVDEADGPPWICIRCTFGNHPLMHICEECNAPKIAEEAQGETQDIHIRVTHHHNISPQRTVHNWVV